MTDEPLTVKQIMINHHSDDSAEEFIEAHYDGISIKDRLHHCIVEMEICLDISLDDEHIDHEESKQMISKAKMILNLIAEETQKIK